MPDPHPREPPVLDHAVDCRRADLKVFRHLRYGVEGREGFLERRLDFSRAIVAFHEGDASIRIRLVFSHWNCLLFGFPAARCRHLKLLDKVYRRCGLLTPDGKRQGPLRPCKAKLVLGSVGDDACRAVKPRHEFVVRDVLAALGSRELAQRKRVGCLTAELVDRILAFAEQKRKILNRIDGLCGDAAANEAVKRRDGVVQPEDGRCQVGDVVGLEVVEVFAGVHSLAFPGLGRKAARARRHPAIFLKAWVSVRSVLILTMSFSAMS